MTTVAESLVCEGEAKREADGRTNAPASPTAAKDAARAARERLLQLRLKRRGLVEAIPRRASGATVPLTPAQESLWFLDQLNGPGDVYLISRAYHLQGELCPASLQSALAGLVERHEVLRSALGAHDGALRLQLLDAQQAAAALVLQP
ncbi:MAG: hypothetical protein JNJ42_06000, partial [Burkholderiaceae bacterium]|nr:hypothetical protein [Burkholderiaceae bacterium]